MPRKQNSSRGTVVKITVSEQSAALLEEIARRGIYGRNVGEVAGRFVDAALQGFVETPRLTLPSKAPKQKE